MKEKIQIHTDKIRQLARNIIADERFQNIENIYGIPKGGIPFAVTIANFSHKPLILDYRDIRDNTLVVDDIVDKGEILLSFDAKMKKLGHKPTYAVIVTKLSANPESIKLLSFSGYETEGNEWIIFPWEDNENVEVKKNGTEIF